MKHLFQDFDKLSESQTYFPIIPQTLIPEPSELPILHTPYLMGFIPQSPPPMSQSAQTPGNSPPSFNMHLQCLLHLSLMKYPHCPCPFHVSSNTAPAVGLHDWDW